MRSLRSLAIAAFAASGIASAAALTVDAAQHAIDAVRNARYCEIIPVARSGFHLVATVYNTLGLNDCPAAVWDKITEAEMKKRFGAIKVLLNGPRHFVMDKIVAGGSTAAGEKIDAGGLELTERASIDLDLFGMRSEHYRERTIDRDTRYVFEAGKPVFLLVAPDGTRYAMQAYAQMIDKSLSYEDLPGDRAGRSRRHVSKDRLSGVPLGQFEHIPRQNFSGSSHAFGANARHCRRLRP
jgi:hypothetical protein